MGKEENKIIDKKCKTNVECFKKQHKKELIKLNYRWIIFCLIEIIVLLLTYKFWGKPEPLENLISIGSGLISITLGIFAILYAMFESSKTNTKEIKVDTILDKILENVADMQIIVDKIQNVTIKTFENVEEIYKSFNFKQYDHYKIQDNNLSTTEEETRKSKNNIEIEKNPASSHVVKTIRGDVYIADLGEGKPGEISGNRPVIVVQNNIANKYSTTVSVIPMTTRIIKHSLPTHIKFIDIRINKEAIALVDQVRTIGSERLIRHEYTLDAETLHKIDDALLIQFGLVKI